MTPPKKKAKYEELVIIDVAKGRVPSKPTQIVSCSQSRNSHHAVVENISHYIGKSAAERLKEKEK